MNRIDIAMEQRCIEQKPVIVRAPYPYENRQKWYQGIGYIKELRAASVGVYFPDFDCSCGFPPEWIHDAYFIKEMP